MADWVLAFYLSSFVGVRDIYARILLLSVPIRSLEIDPTLNSQDIFGLQNAMASP